MEVTKVESPQRVVGIVVDDFSYYTKDPPKLRVGTLKNLFLNVPPIFNLVPIKQGGYHRVNRRTSHLVKKLSPLWRKTHYCCWWDSTVLIKKTYKRKTSWAKIIFIGSNISGKERMYLIIWTTSFMSQFS